MDIMDPLDAVAPRVKVVGKLTVRALESLPLPALLVVFFVCLAFMFQCPRTRDPLLPLSEKNPPADRLVPLPPNASGNYVYLDTSARRLVVSHTPLLSRPARQSRVACGARKNKLRALLRAYRPPLQPVGEEEVVDLTFA